MKTRWDLLPVDPIERAAQVMTFGAEKHHDVINAWVKKYTTHECYAALMRHLMSWRKGQDVDPESGISHLAHVIVRACFIMELERNASKSKEKSPVLMEGGGHD